MPVAFVIGGARRLGRSISRRLGQLGYDLGVTYNTSTQHAQSLQDEMSLLGRRVTIKQCDIRDDQSLAKTWNSLTSELGVPDVVVISAGVFPDAKSPIGITSEQFIDAIRVNTLPLVLIAGRYAQDCVDAQRSGRIISLGSLGATEIWKDRLLYNASKAAARTSALSLARSLAPTLSINIVAPGAIVQPDDVSDSDKSLIPIERIPMLRHGSDDDVCDAVLYFAQASTYITGQTIYVDGGYGLTR